jgi:hypothetical protein
LLHPSGPFQNLLESGLAFRRFNMCEYNKLFSVLVLTIGCAASQVVQAEDAALRFRGSEAVVSPVDVWTGDGWYSFGESSLLHAKLQFFDVTFEKSDGDTWIGSESGVFDFGDGDEFQVKCRFVLEYVTNPAGVSRILSSCNIVGGKGIFQNASGLETFTGSYGPGVSFPGQTPDGQTWYCAGEEAGVILGVDPKAVADKLARRSPTHQFRAVRRRR